MIAITQLDGEHYEVVVDGEGGRTEHRVRLPPALWQTLTDRRVTAEALILESFRFLLAREPATAILREFELSVIGEYFPEWRDHLAAWLEAGA